jgi:acid phosphatase family membrane protein YuiD
MSNNLLQDVYNPNQQQNVLAAQLKEILEMYNKYHEYIVGGLMGILIAVFFFLGV